MANPTAEFSRLTQEIDNSLVVDVVVRPPFFAGEGLGDFLYGETGEATVQTLAANDEYSHVELRLAPKDGRRVAEMSILMTRFGDYLRYEPNPMIYKQVRSWDSIREEAEMNPQFRTNVKVV